MNNIGSGMHRLSAAAGTIARDKLERPDFLAPVAPNVVLLTDGPFIDVGVSGRIVIIVHG